MRSTERKEKTTKLLRLEDHAPALGGDGNPVAHTIRSTAGSRKISAPSEFPSDRKAREHNDPENQRTLHTKR